MLTPVPPLIDTPPNGHSGRMHELPEQPLKVRAVGG
jgi:hypothetical protein